MGQPPRFHPGAGRDVLRPEAIRLVPAAPPAPGARAVPASRGFPLALAVPAALVVPLAVPAVRAALVAASAVLVVMTAPSPLVTRAAMAG